MLFCTKLAELEIDIDNILAMWNRRLPKCIDIDRGLDIGYLKGKRLTSNPVLICKTLIASHCGI